ncbi:MAG: TIR domain-containing protein, partial [Methylococcaceae bacterium]|nr:TIR domain-containing protein [Methylococcaceae bacterium]
NSRFLKGKSIYVEKCPLTIPPIAIVKQGNAAILNYFEEIANGTDYLYEAKLLLVGAGDAGKTSLVRRLYQPEKELPKPEETTKGIDIYRHEFMVQDSRYPNGRPFRLNVWDFAGQDKYRPTDTFFFSQRSLYVLLDDTRNDDKTVHDAGFKYWLEAVEFFSNHSPVLIFQNERAGRSKDIDFIGIQSKFNVKACYQGDLNEPNAADGLRDAIELYAKQLPHIGEELPALWLKIRAYIEQLAQQQATIPVKEFFALYEKHLPFDRVKALHLSRYLHDLGVFLHYQDDDLLSRTVILQNQWATEAVFKILDDETVKAKLGRFTTADCQRLWQESDYADMHLELRALMEKFELCYALSDSEPKTWLAPQLLTPSKPAELSDWAKAGDLVLRYQYEFLPKGMISRLMVRKHYFVPRPELAWLTGVLFERDDTQVLIELSSKGDEIVLRARGLERKDLLGIIAAELNALNASFTGLSDKVTQWIPCCCPQCKTREQPESFERKKLLDKLKQGRQITYCPDSDEKVSVMELLDGVQTKNKEDTMKKIFISYSKHDKRHKNNLIKQLTGLRGKVITWNDADLLAGEDWDERITEELQQADIVLYLVSANSMATEYIQKVELPLIQERCERDECRLVPIIVDFCHWTALDFAKKNALPNKGTPVTDSAWKNQNQAWMTVIQQLEKIV